MEAFFILSILSKTFSGVSKLSLFPRSVFRIPRSSQKVHHRLGERREVARGAAGN